MGNERTFTKWLAMGLQIGAIGTFVLLMVDRDNHGNSAWGITTFLVAWAVGFSLASGHHRPSIRRGRLAALRRDHGFAWENNVLHRRPKTYP